MEMEGQGHTLKFMSRLPALGCSRCTSSHYYIRIPILVLKPSSIQFPFLLSIENMGSTLFLFVFMRLLLLLSSFVLMVANSNSSSSSSMPWFKVAVSVTDSDGLETYRSRCIGRVSADTQKKKIKIFKNY